VKFKNGQFLNFPIQNLKMDDPTDAFQSDRPFLNFGLEIQESSIFKFHNSPISKLRIDCLAPAAAGSRLGANVRQKLRHAVDAQCLCAIERGAAVGIFRIHIDAEFNSHPDRCECAGFALAGRDWNPRVSAAQTNCGH
jgi:hypothetical protein